MQPRENPAKVLLGLHGDSTEGFLLKNLYCLEWKIRLINHFKLLVSPNINVIMFNINEIYLSFSFWNQVILFV